MTDDIVTRLRKQMSNEFVIEHPNMVRVPTLYEQAADQIERLRAENHGLRIKVFTLLKKLEEK